MFAFDPFRLFDLFVKGSNKLYLLQQSSVCIACSDSRVLMFKRKTILGLAHTVIGTAGEVADVTQAHALMHGDEKLVLADASYQGVEKREKNQG